MNNKTFEKWKPPYNLVLDTTTYCNAKCPQCSRTNPTKGSKLSFRGKVVDNLPLIHVPFEKIQKTFNESFLNQCNEIQLCPTWGDHMMHPHAAEIVNYFLSSNDKVIVSINTNGSMRDEDYWWQMCLDALKHSKNNKTRRLRIVFAIDGIDQEMHSLYRRNTNLQKVLDHMKIVSEFKDTVKIQSQTVLFKHNEQYLADIQQLCKQYGSQQHSSVVSTRFNNKMSSNGNIYEFYDENDNKLQLHRVTDHWEQQFIQDGAKVSKGTSDQLSHTPTCGWSLKNTLNINFDGNVWPCCYFGNSDIMRRQQWTSKNEFIQRYYNYNNNIYETPLDQILNNDWWLNLPHMLKSQNPVTNCIQYCTNRTHNKQQRRKIISI